MNSRLLTASRSRNMLTVLQSGNMLTRTAALAAACILSTAAAWAQAPAAAGSAASVKVGVINFRTAVGNTAEGKLAEAELQSQIAPRRTEIENLNKQINDLRQRLQAGQGKISPDEEARLTREGQRLTTQLDRKNTEYQEDLNAALGDIFERIGRKMNDVLDRYGRENGFSVVFDSSAQSTPILYVSTQIDVTQDIIRLYDQAYPIKAAAAAPAKPATPKPAPAASQPPAAKPQH